MCSKIDEKMVLSYHSFMQKEKPIGKLVGMLMLLRIDPPISLLIFHL
jgi:hypothetical protein